MPERAACQTHDWSGQPTIKELREASLLASLTALCELMAAQTAAINRLAASNEALVQAMAEADGEGFEPEDHGIYLDGSKRR